MADKIVLMPPLERQIKHCWLGEYNIFRVCTQYAEGWSFEKGFSWMDADSVFFFFPESKVFEQMLKEASTIDPFKGDFWIVNNEDFTKIRIGITFDEETNPHDIYIHKDAPYDNVINDLEEILFHC